MKAPDVVLALMAALGLSVPAHAANVGVQFEKLFGGTGNEILRAVVVTSDGSFVAAGHSSSFNASPTDFTDDVVVIKTDKNGVQQWMTQYGDPLVTERPRSSASLRQTPDGGFIVAFQDENGPPGSVDSGLLKLDANGAIQWAKHYGGASTDAATSVEVTSDGYVLAGSTFSTTIPGFESHNDFWVVKTDMGGNLMWQFAYGRFGGVGTSESAHDVEVVAGGYVVTGISYGHPGGARPVTLRLDANGVKLSEDFSILGAQTPDGGSIVAGRAPSPAGDWDFFLEKRDAGGNVLFSKRYGDVNSDVLLGMDLTSDGGYVMSGYFGSTATRGAGSEDAWVIKTDSAGNVDWDVMLGQASEDEAFAVRETPDGNFVVAGFVENWLPPQGLGGWDMYLAVLGEIPDPGLITGSVFADNDSSCSQDLPQDIGLGYTLVRAVNQADFKTYLAQTDLAGDYQITVPPGTYAVSAVHSASRQETCNGGAGVVHMVSVSAGVTAPNNDFAIVPVLHGACTIDGRPIPTVPPTACGGTPYDCLGKTQTTPCDVSPWTSWMYCITYVNNGTIDYVDRTRLDIQVSTPELFNCRPGQCDGVVSNTCGNPPYPRRQSGAHVWGWELDPGRIFAANGSCEICVQVDVAGPAPYLNVASISALQAGPPNLKPKLFDCRLTENSSCSCDPNDLTVSPRGCPPAGDVQLQPLTYKVRFQNTGAGPATDVVIRADLDADLDLETLIVVASSHTITGLEVDAGGQLTLAFEGIGLPPEASDPEGSNGSVTFRLTPSGAVADGTEISHRAAIFFDDNPPVITNTVTNTLYHGDPVPIAAFDVVADGAHRDFTYSGGTSGATFEWRFGDGATPATSSDQSPSVTYATPGARLVSLIVTKGSCSSSTVEVVDVAGCTDDDGDGFGNPGDSSCPGGPATDCDDQNDQVFPGVTEDCNGFDDDCDGQIDEGFDQDDDGFTTCAGDCDDLDPAIGPDAAEVCNAIDDDCDGQIDEGFDQDGDGVADCFDNCPSAANDQTDSDQDGTGDACDPCPLDAFDDADGDGVCGDLDRCPDTAIPESVPTVRLKTHRWAQVDDDLQFDTDGSDSDSGNDSDSGSDGGGSGRSYATTDTGGCSCEQIIEVCGHGRGHVRFGCSNGVMDLWTGLYDRQGQEPLRCDEDDDDSDSGSDSD